jgi:hypothetical protein
MRLITVLHVDRHRRWHIWLWTEATAEWSVHPTVEMCGGQAYPLSHNLSEIRSKQDLLYWHEPLALVKVQWESGTNKADHTALHYSMQLYCLNFRCLTLAYVLYNVAFSYSFGVGQYLRRPYGFQRQTKNWWKWLRAIPHCLLDSHFTTAPKVITGTLFNDAGTLYGVER